MEPTDLNAMPFNITLTGHQLMNIMDVLSHLREDTYNHGDVESSEEINQVILTICRQMVGQLPPSNERAAAQAVLNLSDSLKNLLDNLPKD